MEKNKVCPQKINGSCPLHNLHCAYPKCEESGEKEATIPLSEAFEFTEWCSSNKWQRFYNQGKYNWIQICFEISESKTTIELYQLFKESKDK